MYSPFKYDVNFEKYKNLLLLFFLEKKSIKYLFFEYVVPSFQPSSITWRIFHPCRKSTTYS